MKMITINSEDARDQLLKHTLWAIASRSELYDILESCSSLNRAYLKNHIRSSSVNKLPDVVCMIFVGGKGDSERFCGLDIFPPCVFAPCGTLDVSYCLRGPEEPSSLSQSSGRGRCAFTPVIFRRDAPGPTPDAISMTWGAISVILPIFSHSSSHVGEIAVLCFGSISRAFWNWFDPKRFGILSIHKLQRSEVRSY